MKYIKVFENFNEEDIHEICKEWRITNYTINSDGSVDVDGDVNLSDKNLVELPLRFGKVTGKFNISGNEELGDLVGCPKYVGKNFLCHYCGLTSLEGCPSEVGGDMYLYANDELFNPTGITEKIKGDFYYFCPNGYADPVPFHWVYDLFPNHKSFIDSLDYNYFRGGKINKTRLFQALEELMDPPSGYKWE